ncbi:GcrA family cell cycle regulator [Novosphingobium mangrovi (ex Huang et al. 2023)]|uniref:GcrA family cell cycle regulator n=1 Tax=Novosphingobium mangrovi (ex Huang et al. 2023) TaxID=2976432 RepID=A0ABT2I1Y9_9SPHN|nr:GcrA family cell cycle regulator [Novosphingobium mangrovi (ex Huang et al. 2023)]MCT2398822.1 GcrA family cell cycle regulator [Novosphingobium mangrovi (ex Huang et al. 2023)]
MSWTDERIEKLTKMWEGGATASQIAEELGGVSRNAVIGKAHRLGLKARPSPVKANEKPARPAAPKKVKPAVEAPPARAAQPASEAPPRASAPAPAAPAAQPVRAAPAAAPAAAPEKPASDQPRIISVGPGGFLRQGPGDQQPPIPPAPPRRLVPAKPSPEIADKTSLLDLNDRICRWPMGHPGEADFHFCGEKVNPGFPYCVEHCGRAYQAQLPRGARRPPPPLPFGGPRVR